MLTEYYLNQVLPSLTTNHYHCPIYGRVYHQAVNGMPFYQALPQIQGLVKECIEQVVFYAPNAVIASSHSDPNGSGRYEEMALPYRGPCATI